MLNLSEVNKNNLPILYDEVVAKGYKGSFQEFINELIECAGTLEVEVENERILIKKTAFTSLNEYIEKLEQFKEKTKLIVSEDEQLKTLQEALGILGFRCKDWCEFYDQIERLKVDLTNTS